jgi:hypothetical protein
LIHRERASVSLWWSNTTWGGGDDARAGARAGAPPCPPLSGGRHRRAGRPLLLGPGGPVPGAGRERRLRQRQVQGTRLPSRAPRARPAATPTRPAWATPTPPASGPATYTARASTPTSQGAGPLPPTPPPPSAARTASRTSYALRWRGATEGARRAAPRPSPPFPRGVGAPSDGARGRAKKPLAHTL